MCRPKARAVQVDAHKSAVLLIRIVHRLEAIGHSGIIHEYVDAAVLCDYGIGKAADRAGISHVERLELRAVARLSKRTSGRAAVFLDNFCDDHRGACLCQGARDFEADASAGAGDNSNSILQTEFLEIHKCSSVVRCPVCCCSGEFSSPDGGVKPPLYQTLLLRVSFFVACEESRSFAKFTLSEANGRRMTCHSERSEESAFGCGRAALWYRFPVPHSSNLTREPGMRAIATLGGQIQRTAKAIAWLRANYVKPLRLEELGEVASMGMSTLHHHFRALTAMSPLHYQKQLRLQAARERMLIEGLDAASAAFNVGYESASQFNREYKRFFGQPPMRDVKSRRLAGSAAVTD
jgi:AraC-like DNA-binding protein